MRNEPAQNFPRAEDTYDRLWTPHRMAYIHGESKPASNEPRDCPFCAAPARSDDEGLIVHRGDTCYVVLNLFPYNPGHLLVCPYRHVADFTDLTDTERYESADLVAQYAGATAPRVRRFNLGMNQGAGRAGSLHAHQRRAPLGGTRTSFRSSARPKHCPTARDHREGLASEWKEWFSVAGRGVQHPVHADRPRSFGSGSRASSRHRTATTITALVCSPGHLVVGSLVLGVLVLTDSIDGIMARGKT